MKNRREFEKKKQHLKDILEKSLIEAAAEQKEAIKKEEWKDQAVTFKKKYFTQVNKTFSPNRKYIKQ